MDQKELAALTDEELLQAAKKMKSDAVINAGFIGFLIGVVFYSVMKNGFGFFLLIPLFLIYKLINNKPKYNKQEVEQLLKERNLK
ncbi:hypothetical protein ACTJIJ_03360 [Niabella sp. 22666]|uniref:hypothetical protein n=1 Tax=Niabella sp. 22666 TaxID=3453954 RepID=UPI003F868EA0